MLYKFINIIILIIFILIILTTATSLKKQSMLNKVKEISKNKIPLNDEIINFPKYYINLDISKDRNDSIVKHFNDYNISNYQRVKAFNGNKINNKNKGEIDNYQYNNLSNSCTKKELAITMSHLVAMKKAKEDGHQSAIIMEDDCRFNLVPYWEKNFNTILNEIPEDCEILLLANRKYKKGDFKIIEADCSQFVGVCYLITSKGMEKLDKFIKNKTINLELKNIIFDQGFMKTFKVYTYDKPLFLLDNFEFYSTHNFNPLLNYESKQILNNFDKIFN